MSEILIAEPQLSSERLASFSWLHPEHLDEIIEVARIRGLDSRKRVLDYCAGNGSVARKLVDIGICQVTCIDRYIPRAPLVDPSLFLYAYLHRLAIAISSNERLPEEIACLRGQFDWMIGMQTELSDYVHPVLAQYFLRPGGYIYPDEADIRLGSFKADGIFYRYVPEIPRNGIPTILQ